nr:hypothetical protein CFP56_07723 [Quercus suber]
MEEMNKGETSRRTNGQRRRKLSGPCQHFRTPPAPAPFRPATLLCSSRQISATPTRNPPHHKAGQRRKCHEIPSRPQPPPAWNPPRSRVRGERSSALPSRSAFSGARRAGDIGHSPPLEEGRGVGQGRLPRLSPLHQRGQGLLPGQIHHGPTLGSHCSLASLLTPDCEWPSRDLWRVAEAWRDDAARAGAGA